MPAELADLCIEARWIAVLQGGPRILENHAVMVRDGRILAVLPRVDARRRYAPTLTVELATHLLLPGLVNACTDAAAALLRGFPCGFQDSTAATTAAGGADFVRDGTRLAIAAMIRGGITCFANAAALPEVGTVAAVELGMRVVAGLPASDFTGALRWRDEYQGHPLVSTVFSVPDPTAVSDAVLVKLATLGDELEVGLMAPLCATEEEISRCVAMHGCRPPARLRRVGLLSPALHAIGMDLADDEDLVLAFDAGIAVSACPRAALARGGALPVLPRYVADVAGGVASGYVAAFGGPDLWPDLHLLGLAALAGQLGPRPNFWPVLAMATQGGATALGLGAETGAIESGRWADLCAVDLSRPATQPLTDPLHQLLLGGGRDLVTDVWVAGRQLLAGARFTRFDWQEVSQRAAASVARLIAA